MVQTPAATRWAAIIERQEASGQTIRAFAAANDLNPSTLGWWRSRLGRAKKAGPRKKRKRTAATFSELKVAEHPEDRTVVVALEQLDAHIVVDEQTDLALLRQILEALC